MHSCKSRNYKVGIDAIKFYVPNYVLNLSDLAEARNIHDNKYKNSYGQEKMSVPSIDEDIVTMSANAAIEVMKDVNKDEIGFLILATETGIDASKSAGMFIHRLLNLPKDCRVLELKQACYSGTGGIALSIPFLRQNPNKKILLITADIAKYTICSAAESSGGAAAVAMILSVNPRILEIEQPSGVYTEDSMDFWRPNYAEEPILNSKLSCNLYMKFLCESFDDYIKKGGTNLDNIDYFCYHLSVPRLTITAHKRLYKYIKNKSITNEVLKRHIEASSIYGKHIGNCYTASLYLSLISLLDNESCDLSGKRIAFYSYGSGSISEFFSGVVKTKYKDYIDPEYNKKLIDRREKISVEQYEKWHRYLYPTDGSKLELPILKKNGYRLSGFEKHMRIYEENSS
ncbi:MAG: hydroxymethylglutaryl-CoA synthase [Rickettsiales bacterium]|nr:hydroxymethylglutaryl-CoA synthase [Rickettsiales bacterium]